MTGRTLSYYKVLDKLGQGGMGAVYRALDTRLDRLIALKVLTPEAVENPERKKRLVQEAKAASALNHPSIITIYEIGFADGVDFIAMEYVKGATLADLIGGQPLPLADALRYAVQITDALHQAHRVGIVHRDLKPGNLMVSGPASAHPGLVKVLDFGLAKLNEPAANDSLASTKTAGALEPPRTGDGTILGTLAYMSPEQAEGKLVDLRSDIFSFGLVLYEMVTGRRVFQADSKAAILAAILRDEPPPSSEVVAGLPPALDAIIARCLRKDPARRCQSLADVKVLLLELSESVTAEAAPPGPRPRRRWAVAAALSLALVALGLAVTPAVRERLPVWLASPGIPSDKQITVLPFQNVGADPANQALCDGFAETLTSMLAQLEQFHGTLHVVPASEVRNQSVTSARDARRAFGVNLVITGSVQQAGDRIVLTANLVDAVALRQLDARTIVVSREDTSALHDGVITQVAELLRLPLPPQARQLLSAGGTLTPGAYDFYLQGRGYLQRFDIAGSLDNAKSLFQKALERDPNYALAHAGLAETYLREYLRTKAPEFLEKGRAAGSRSVEIDERVAPARVTLAMVYSATGQYPEAVRELERALQIDPVNAGAFRELARAYEKMGKPQEAEATYRKAIQVRPGDWLSHSNLGIFYSNQGRYAEAEAPFRRVVDLTPDNHTGPRNLGGVYYLLGRYPEAEQMLRRSISLRPTAAAYSNLGTVFFAQGRYRDAVPMMEKAIEVGGKRYAADYIVWANLADSYRAVPELRDKAPEAYGRAIRAAEQQLAVNAKDAYLMSKLAEYCAKSGDHARALREIATARRLLPADPKMEFQSLVVYELCGQRDRALTALGELVRSRYPLEEVRRAPELEDLRKDARYERLLSASADRGPN